MNCKDCVGNGNCAYNIMLPYIKGSANVGDDNPRGKMVNVDKCLLPEILKLWERGIKTTGCCCGHGLPEPYAPYIGVKSEYCAAMIALGYIKKVNPDEYDQNEFIPITTLVYGDADKGHNWWDKEAEPNE